MLTFLPQHQVPKDKSRLHLSSPALSKSHSSAAIRPIVNDDWTVGGSVHCLVGSQERGELHVVLRRKTLDVVDWDFHYRLGH